MKNLAIVVQNDGYDRLLTPLTFAWVHAKRGVHVDLLFTLWAVRVLTETHVDSLRVDGAHAKEEPWLRERLAGAGFPVEIRDYLQGLKNTGKVNLYACAIAAGALGVKREDLLPSADGMMDPAAFFEEKALNADLCQNF